MSPLCSSALMKLSHCLSFARPTRSEGGGASSASGYWSAIYCRMAEFSVSTVPSSSFSAATGLNRPSLYGAFGDKRALYLQASGRYRKRMNESFAPLFAAREPLRTKLTRILTAALDLYLSGPDGPRGCFTVLSAASEAIADPDLHSLVSEAIDGTDRAFGRLFADARSTGELPADADPRRLGRGAPGAP